MKLISVSGGKDSTATLLLALEQHPHESIKAVFADTGNEHESTIEYLAYLEQTLGITIHHVKADFTDQFQHRIDYIRTHWYNDLTSGHWQRTTPRGDKTPRPAAPANKYQPTETEKFRWIPATSDHYAHQVVMNALSVLEQGTTGNPYFDLCLLKARFPSRMAQFCTTELKVYPILTYALNLIDQFGSLESWVGVRADESKERAKLPAREDKGGGYTLYRPLLQWNITDVFSIHKKHHIKPNPLYLQDMTRVGCMPCINCSKKELLNISKRFPEHIERIAQWEQQLCKVAKRQSGTFFSDSQDNTNAYQRSNIHQQVAWSKTKRGGIKNDLFAFFEEPLACSSAYGLCE